MASSLCACSPWHLKTRVTLKLGSRLCHLNYLLWGFTLGVRSSFQGLCAGSSVAVLGGRGGLPQVPARARGLDQWSHHKGLHLAPLRMRYKNGQEWPLNLDPPGFWACPVSSCFGLCSLYDTYHVVTWPKSPFQGQGNTHGMPRMLQNNTINKDNHLSSTQFQVLSL